MEEGASFTQKNYKRIHVSRKRPVTARGINGRAFPGKGQWKGFILGRKLSYP
jgi:hypothetical protein